jgi:hypothetical protein
LTSVSSYKKISGWGLGAWFHRGGGVLSRYYLRMEHTDTTAHGFPIDVQSILELAAQSMFQLFSSISQGMLLVDRTSRIVWVNDGYKRFLPALGFSSVDQFVGHMVEEVIPNTQMRRVFDAGEDF